MKKLLAAIFGVFLLVAGAEARLGETFEECEKRYGKSDEGFDYEVDEKGGIKKGLGGDWVKGGVKAKYGNTIRRWILKPQDLWIEIIFQNNKAVWIKYQRLDGEKFTKEFAQDLIEKNMGSLQMKETEKETPNPKRGIVSKNLKETFWVSEGSEYAILRTWEREVALGRGETEYRDCSDLTISATGFAKPQMPKTEKAVLDSL